MEEVAPPKRGRGRPPGSLNKKTLARQAELARAEETPPDEFVLDVEFDEGQQPVPEEPPAESPEELPEPPRLSRQRSVRMGRVSESHVSAPTILSPRPAKRQRPKPVAKTVAKTVAKPVEEPPNYLEVLKQGLAIAKASHKAEKVARYDSFFRM